MSISDCNAPIPQRVIEIVSKKGLKQCSVAERAGFSTQQFTDIINGRRLIKASEIPRIAQALGVNPSDLFFKATDHEDAS